MSTTTSSDGSDGSDKGNTFTATANDASILDLKHATEHCKGNVKKFDYAAFRVAAHLPTST